MSRTPATRAWASPHWMTHSLCARPGYRELDWFPENSSAIPDKKLRNQYRQQQLSERRKLKEICSACPVTAECHDYAEQMRATVGYWAGQNYSRRHAVEEV
jgi:Transcription factor WhiB